MTSNENVSVPRTTLAKWSRTLAVLAQDEHLGAAARETLTELGDDIHLHSTHRAAASGVHVSQIMDNVEAGSTVVGYVDNVGQPLRPRRPGR